MMLEPLVAIMDRLRDPVDGCDWDREQTFRSIAPYTIEEAYEVADACERDDMASLRDELGDLQLQVVFHSRIAEERGAFTLADVVAGICAKLERRHPHLFGDGGHPGWEAIKAAERAQGVDKSMVAGIAQALPALSRAGKLQQRAGVAAPERIDLDAADEVAAGDLLFAVVGLLRCRGIDAETALRRANARFERDVRQQEAAGSRSQA